MFISSRDSAVAASGNHQNIIMEIQSRWLWPSSGSALTWMDMVSYAPWNTLVNISASPTCAHHCVTPADGGRDSGMHDPVHVWTSGTCLQDEKANACVVESMARTAPPASESAGGMGSDVRATQARAPTAGQATFSATETAQVHWMEPCSRGHAASSHSGTLSHHHGTCDPRADETPPATTCCHPPAEASPPATDNRNAQAKTTTRLSKPPRPTSTSARHGIDRGLKERPEGRAGHDPAATAPTATHPAPPARDAEDRSTRPGGCTAPPANTFPGSCHEVRAMVSPTLDPPPPFDAADRSGCSCEKMSVRMCCGSSPPASARSPSHSAKHDAGGSAAAVGAAGDAEWTLRATVAEADEAPAGDLVLDNAAELTTAAVDDKAVAPGALRSDSKCSDGELSGGRDPGPSGAERGPRAAEEQAPRAAADDGAGERYQVAEAVPPGVDPGQTPPVTSSACRGVTRADLEPPAREHVMPSFSVRWYLLQVSMVMAGVAATCQQRRAKRTATRSSACLAHTPAASACR